jgi:hypothetical protein
LTSLFTDENEKRALYMSPIPKEVGTVECSIVRNKSGFNIFYPKYQLKLSKGENLLLSAKKKSGTKTSYYMVTIDHDNLKKKGKGFLGKVRANFMGT